MWTPSYDAGFVSILALVVACLSVAIFVWRSSNQAVARNVGGHAGRTGTGIAASPMPTSDNADLLRLRMEMLHIDGNALARSDPLRLHEFRRICANCASRGACAVDLAHPSADVGWGEWREYCPNAAKLNELRIRAMMRSRSDQPGGPFDLHQ
jgi:hypothetical protein